MRPRTITVDTGVMHRSVPVGARTVTVGSNGCYRRPCMRCGVEFTTPAPGLHPLCPVCESEASNETWH